MIAFRNFVLRRGERLLLSDVDLTLHAGWRVGVVGRNGCGKSSLFAALMGELEADRGDLDVPSRLRIASVAQETPALSDAAIDFALGGDVAVAAAMRDEAQAMAREDYEAVAAAHHRLEELDGYDATARAGRLLHGLGFPADTHGKPVSEFSGGWRARLNLARALMTPSDLLLLDEPTNHLDLDAVLWLEQWLLKYPGTLLLISHDREFLDNVASHTLHLHEGGAKLYSGDYTAFEHQRAEHLRLQQIAFEKEQIERAHLESFIARFKAKASKAKQAQSRMKRLAKLAGTAAVRAERSLHIEFPAPAKLPNSLIRLNHADAGYALKPHSPRKSGWGEGPEIASSHPWSDSRSTSLPHPQSSSAISTSSDASGHHGALRHGWQLSPEGEGRSKVTILHDVNFGLEAGDRVGLLGANGAGKSTLVKTLVGELPLLAGERNAHPDLCIGYFAQHTVESLRAGQSPIDHLRELSPTTPVQALRDFLGKWNFPGDRAFENIDAFSGGERARLALALIAWRQPNVLLLDEPTNHLDLDMREALAEALSDFDGAIVLVSHDRHLIGLVCETYWRVAHGRVEAFDGDLDQYAAWLRSRPAPLQTASSTQAVSVVKNTAKAAKPNPHKLARAEARLTELESRIAALDARIADPSLYVTPGAHAVELTRQRAALSEELATMEAQLLALYEADAA